MKRKRKRKINEPLLIILMARLMFFLIKIKQQIKLFAVCSHFVICFDKMVLLGLGHFILFGNMSKYCNISSQNWVFMTERKLVTDQFTSQKKAAK